MMEKTNFPDEWLSTNLGSIVEYGKAKKCSLADIDPFTWVLELEDIEKESSRVLQILSAQERPFKSTKNIFNKGNVLYGKLRPYLNKVIIATDDGVCTTEVIPLNAEPFVDNRYIFYWLKSERFLRYVTEVSYGVNMPRLGTKDGIAAPFILPPLAEQKIIADKLDSLLAKVEKTKARLDRIPDILNRFRQSVLAAAVSGRLTEEWRDKNSIKLNDWEATTIGGIAEVATGKTPKRTEAHYWENGTVPWLTSASTGEYFTCQAEQFVTDVAVKECTLKLFPEGTLLLAMYGEGKTRGQVTELKISAACNQACAAILVNEPQVNREFIKIRLLENYEETRKAAAGGAQPNLNLKKVRDIPICLPSQPEQTEIVRRVEQLFTYADTIEQQVQVATERVNKLTQSILAKAFRGDLTKDWRAANPDLISGENSAEALLEKIKAEREAMKPNKKTRAKKEKA